jgi:hypothetical protein
MKQDITKAVRPAPTCKIVGWQTRKELFYSLSREQWFPVYWELYGMLDWFDIELEEIIKKYGAEIVLAVEENTEISDRLRGDLECNHLNRVEAELCIQLEIEIP